MRLPKLGSAGYASNYASSPTPTGNASRTPELPLPPSSSSLFSSSITSTSAEAAPVPTTTAHNPDIPTNVNPPTINTSDVDSIHTCPYCPVHSPHTSAWSVTCESIAQRLANHCLEQKHTPDASALTALTAPAHSPAALAY
ncbi:hypothetical protein SprV_0200880400 [Sparganum proliferum]